MALPIRGYERHLIRTDAEWVADDAVIPMGWAAFGYTGTTLTKVAFGNGDDAYSVLTNSLTGGSGATVFTDLTDVPASYTGASLQVVRVNVGETALEFATIGALTDGDKGDITVSTGGTAWAIDSDVVTNAKMANMAQATVKGRASGAGTGDPADLTPNEVSTILDTATDPFLRTSALPASGLTHPQVMARAQFAAAF